MQLSPSSAAVAVPILAASLVCLMPWALGSGDPIQESPSPDWGQILGEASGERPEPLDEVHWRDDLVEALLEAQDDGRPLLVTVRCLPCKQCATMDKEVMEGGPLLSPLLAQFVTVRLTDAYALDPDLLPLEGFQDLDLSWWAWFLSPEGRVYSIFGGRDEVSDATRISPAALAATMERVLDHHYDPRRAGWDVDGPASGDTVGSRSPRDLPGYDSWLRQSSEGASQSCLHCHQVAEVLRQPAVDARSFDPVADVGIWPLPENVGLSVDRDHGLRVTAVDADGPAAAIGLRVGDELAAAGGRRLFGQADLRGVLHRQANPSGTIELHWLRGADLLSGPLELAAGWRSTVLDWRMSISQGNVGPHPGFGFPLAGPRELAIDGGMSVRPYFGKDAANSPAYAAGLRPHHTIVAVDGENPNLHGRPFLVWFRLNHTVGESVALTVVEGDGRRTIEYVLR